MRAILLFCLLISSFIIQHSSFAAAPTYVFGMEKWPSRAPTVTAAYNLACSEIDQIAAAGADGINISCFEKFEYQGDQPRAVKIRQLNDSLIARAIAHGLEVFTSGPQILKAPGLGQAVALPLRVAAPETLNVNLLRRADSRGFTRWPTAHTVLKSLPVNTYGQLEVYLSGTGGWLYVNWPSGSHITKLQVKPGPNLLTWIALPDLNPASIEYYGTPQDIVSLRKFTLNTPDSSDLRSPLASAGGLRGVWLGSANDQFFHCRALDPQDDQGLYNSIFFAAQHFPRTRHVADWEELNTPIFHDPADLAKWPGGYPEYLGYLVTTYSNITYQLTRLKPLIFSIDTRAGPEELCQHRTTAPVPQGMPCSFLNYVSPTCPFTLVIWGEGGNQAFWDYQLASTAGYDRVAAFYAGTQDIATVMAALQGHPEIPVAICYTAQHWPKVITDFQTVQGLH